MDDWAALKLALELLHVPWRVRLVRTQPLPQGMEPLLRVAAGDPGSETAAIAAADRPREIVRHAAAFFIEQILLAPGADSYRVLGAGPEATNAELRHNMALLMRWLHPDIARQGEQSLFAARIAAAWNNLKTPERRAAYDNERQSAEMPGDRESGRGSASDTMPDRRTRSAKRGPRSRSGGASRRVGASGGRRASGLPRVLAFLLGRPRP